MSDFQIAYVGRMSSATSVMTCGIVVLNRTAGKGHSPSAPVQKKEMGLHWNIVTGNC